ncbi:MAG: hypothetical protein ACLGIR_08725 [Actinomycetes bacterium]
MSRRRRRNRNRNEGGNQNQQSQQQGNRQRRTQQRDDRAAQLAAFWGDPEKLPEPSTEIRITDDPAAVVRSLGPAPLTGHEAISQHYFAAIYDRAVTTAGALAAAGGLIEPDDLAEELGRHDDEDE